MTPITKGQLSDDTIIGELDGNELYGKTLLSDPNGADAMGVAGPAPDPNTLLGRLKAILTALAGTLPVSVESIPLPNGAASETTTEAIRALLAGPLTVTLPTGAATQATLAAILAKMVAAPATEAKQDSAITSIDAVQTTVAEILAKIIEAPATEAKQDSTITSIGNVEAALADILAKIIATPATEAKQDSAISATNLIGTRHYGEAHSRLAYASGASASTGDGVAATEVLLHNAGDSRCYVKSGAGAVSATTDDIPLEPGEKFHLRIATGDNIAAWGEDAGNLNIVPVG